MKLLYVPPTTSSWTEISAAQVDVDAVPPVTRLRLCWPLGEVNADRTAVGAVLAFSPWIGGRCDLEHEFSALTGQRLVEWFQDQGIWVAPSPVHAGPLPLPRGSHRYSLSGDASASPELRFADSLCGSGESPAGVRIASNLGILIANAPTIAAGFEMRLGAAVLIAESLSISELVDPEFEAAAPEAFSRAQRLIECVGLGLRSA